MPPVRTTPVSVVLTLCVSVVGVLAVSVVAKLVSVVALDCAFVVPALRVVTACEESVRQTQTGYLEHTYTHKYTNTSIVGAHTHIDTPIQAHTPNKPTH